jgi:hypothetical protein
MPILDIQKRARELGRIRIGQVVPTTRRDGTAGTRPEKLDRFRLTSNSKPLLDKVAELYGGTVAEWQPQGGGAKAWEVVTNTARIPIMVPPQPITQWYEFWTAGGCKHRCDGQTNVLTDEPATPRTPSTSRPSSGPPPASTSSSATSRASACGAWSPTASTPRWSSPTPRRSWLRPAATSTAGSPSSLAPARPRSRQAERRDEDRDPALHGPDHRDRRDPGPADGRQGPRRRAGDDRRPGRRDAGARGRRPDYVALAADMTDPRRSGAVAPGQRAGHMTQGLSEHLQRRVAELENVGAAQGGAAAEGPGGSSAAAA